MIESGWDVVVGHGNGPQVGFILQKAEIAYGAIGLPMAGLDVCGAQSQGQIGYALAQNLQNELKRRGINKPVASVIEQTVVDRNDPAFSNPTKPIGGFMTEAEAKKRKAEEGWTVIEDAGRGWRRVVASPGENKKTDKDDLGNGKDDKALKRRARAPDRPDLADAPVGDR